LAKEYISSAVSQAIVDGVTVTSFTVPADRFLTATVYMSTDSVAADKLTLTVGTLTHNVGLIAGTNSHTFFTVFAGPGEVITGTGNFTSSKISIVGFLQENP